MYFYTQSNMIYLFLSDRIEELNVVWVMWLKWAEQKFNNFSNIYRCIMLSMKIQFYFDMLVIRAVYCAHDSDGIGKYIDSKMSNHSFEMIYCCWITVVFIFLYSFVHSLQFLLVAGDGDGWWWCYYATTLYLLLDFEMLFHCTTKDN